MKSHPHVPAVEDAPAALLERGHLWLQERVLGDWLRFRMEPSGLLVVGDADGTFGETVPPAYRQAVRHVRDRFDRDAFRGVVERPATVTFFGVAPTYRGVDYDWSRLPSFLGAAVWSGVRDAYLPVDVVEQVYDRLGLEPVNALAKEVNTRDFHPGRYAFPPSAWYDGPVAGIVVRNRNGTAGRLDNPAVTSEESPEPAAGTPEDLATEYVTHERLDRVVRTLRERERAATDEAVGERLFELVLREEDARLVGGRVDLAGLERAVHARVRVLRSD